MEEREAQESEFSLWALSLPTPYYVVSFMVQILSGLAKEPHMEKMAILPVASFSIPLHKESLTLILQKDSTKFSGHASAAHFSRIYVRTSVELKPKDSITPLWQSGIF